MEKPVVSLHNSYFWNCLTLKEDCPFLSTTSPTLYYFGVTLLGLYATFLFIVLIDLKFYWRIDEMQQHIDFYVNMITKKVKLVQRDQGRLVNTQERTEKQLQRSLQGVRMLEEVRDALAADDLRQVNELIQLAEKTMNDANHRNDFPIRVKEKPVDQHQPNLKVS